MKIYEKEVVRNEILQCLKKYFYAYKCIFGKEGYQIKETIKGKDIKRAIEDKDDCSDMFLGEDVSSSDFTECDGEWFYHNRVPVSSSDILNGLLYKACYCISPNFFTTLEFSFEFDRNLLYLQEGHEWTYDLYIVPDENGYRVSAGCHFSLDIGKFFSTSCDFYEEDEFDEHKSELKLYDLVKDTYKKDCFIVLDCCKQIRIYSLDGTDIQMFNADKFFSLCKSIAEENYRNDLFRYYCFFLRSDCDKPKSLRSYHDTVAFID